MRIPTLLFLLFITSVTLAQQEPYQLKDTLEYNIPSFITEAKRDPEYQKKYDKLKRDVLKVMPYAKMAAFRFQMMEQNLQMLPTVKAKEAYLKRTEETIKDQFMDDLINLTTSQGKVLIKLIHRETGKDTYSLLKNYRGNITAWYWQGLAKVFTADLKLEYNPVEDWQIEQIIKQAGYE
jgi:hypothetical protein